MAIKGVLKRRLLTFRREAAVLWFAFSHPHTPRPLKAASLAAMVYLLSPIDLIPFTIPLLGIVDDLVIVPWAVSSIAKRLPAEVREEAGRKADRWIDRWFKRPFLAVVILLLIIVAIWIALLALLYRVVFGS